MTCAATKSVIMPRVTAGWNSKLALQRELNDLEQRLAMASAERDVATVVARLDEVRARLEGLSREADAASRERRDVGRLSRDG